MELISKELQMYCKTYIIPAIQLPGWWPEEVSDLPGKILVRRDALAAGLESSYWQCG
jgi:hypothetical protein